MILSGNRCTSRIKSGTGIFGIMRYGTSTRRPTTLPPRRSSSEACAALKRPLDDRNRRDFPRARERHHLVRLVERSGHGAFDREHAQRKHRDRRRVGPAEQARDDDLAAFGQRACRKRERAVRADEIDRAVDAAGRLEQRLAGVRVGGIVGGRGARLERRLALARIDVGDDRRIGKQRARKREPHHADAAEPDQQHGPALGMLGDALERRECREARAHVGAGERGGERRIIDQVARMRHQHMGREAAVDLDAEMTRRRAEILFTGAAGRALAAPDPGKHGRRLSGLHVRVGAGLLDHARDLVAEREGQRAAGGDVELLVAAEAEIAVMQMDIGMAHAAAADPHQDFAALRLGCLDDRFTQWRRIGSHRLADHAGHCLGFRTFHSCASATKPSTAISSARAVGSIAAFSSSGMGSMPERLQARAQHLAALAEGRGGDALERARGRRAGARRAA